MTTINKNRTTRAIRSALGATYSIAEVEQVLATLERLQRANAPCVDGHVDCQIQTFRALLEASYDEQALGVTPY